jgi:hypothetical protein
MSPLFGADPFAGVHGHARELAATRVDEPLPAAEDAWLEEHLVACEACTAAAAEYNDQAGLLTALRDAQPVPPRDLWARTAAALDAEDRQGGRRSRDTRRERRSWRFGVLPLAPVAAVMVVAIAVGAGLLNGVGLFPPHDSTTKGPDAAMPTPFAVTAGQVQVLTRGADGTLELSVKDIDEVCPVGAAACGTSSATDDTTLDAIAGLGSFDAVISPTNDHIVLMQRDGQSSGVFVVPVRDTTTPATPSPTPAPTPTPSSDTATPTATVPGSPEVTPPASPGTTPEATPEATPDPTEPPTASPSPTVEVTPAPDGTIEIARNVILVGNVSGYSTDGSRFAFTARPADGSSGPDVYVWVTSEREARPITTDHASVFSAWTGGRMLVSRVVDGDPVTALLDPATGTEQALPDAAIWRPTVGPDGRTALWWEGTVVPSADGFTWRPDKGRLVLGAWPPDAARPQVLDKGKIRDWEVHWDETGAVVALWVAADRPDATGSLSLYVVDAETGAVNVDKPLLEDAEAFAGFSLRSGRLAWSAPAPGGDTTVEVLAWTGDTIGRLQLPTESGVTVVR